MEISFSQKWAKFENQKRHFQNWQILLSLPKLETFDRSLIEPKVANSSISNIGKIKEK